jgi:hypothetical protein
VKLTVHQQHILRSSMYGVSPPRAVHVFMLWERKTFSSVANLGLSPAATFAFRTLLCGPHHIVALWAAEDVRGYVWPSSSRSSKSFGVTRQKTTAKPLLLI